MPAMFNEDLSQFFDTDDFAVEVTHVPASGGPSRTFRAIYDDPYLNPQLGMYELDTSDPRITAPWPLVASVKRSDIVIVNDTRHTVVTWPQPDGTGLGTLKLSAVTGDEL